MAGQKRLKTLRAIVESEGIEVTGFVPAAGAHHKMQCRIGPRTFYILASASAQTGQRGDKNFRARARRIRRAFDDDPTLFEQLIRPK